MSITYISEPWLNNKPWKYGRGLVWKENRASPWRSIWKDVMENSVLGACWADVLPHCYWCWTSEEKVPVTRHGSMALICCDWDFDKCRAINWYRGLLGCLHIEDHISLHLPSQDFSTSKTCPARSSPLQRWRQPWVSLGSLASVMNMGKFQQDSQVQMLKGSMPQ